MTGLDIAITYFYNSAGGADFFGVIFAVPVIFAIIYSIIRPLNK